MWKQAKNPVQYRMLIGYLLFNFQQEEPETRMKIISHQSLSNKFADVIKESQSVQLEYKAAVKDKLARQAKIYDNTLSPEQVDDIINDPEVIEQIHYKHFMRII